MTTVLSWAGVANDPRTRRAQRSRGAEVRRLRLVVLDGPDRGAEHVIEAGRRESIGTAEDNDWRLTDPTVSRYHLEVRSARGGAQVTDLGSRNGTFAGPIKVETAVVPLGSRLGLGNSAVQIEEAGEGPLGELTDAAVVEVPGMVAESAAMREIARQLPQLARSEVTVLVQGETGTGKEVVARALHTLSPRNEAPFIVVDCGSLPGTLVASELFGHERGSFTGADRQHQGAFERADKGTIFLDEVGELAPEVQASLLGVLERRSFRRVGGTEELNVDVRVIAATHRDLRGVANTGTFRPDLYFRLAVARLVLPPLRERPEDIAALVGRFAEDISGDPTAEPFDPATLASLKNQHWAGNARELRNAVETALALGTMPLQGAPARQEPMSAEQVTAYRDARAETLADFERTYLSRLMRLTENNASKAARWAQMDRPYLLTLLKKHGLR